MYKIFTVAALTAILFLTSCSTGDGHRRGSLKDAMRKSADNHQGSRKVNSSDNNSNTSTNLGDLFGFGSDDSKDSSNSQSTDSSRVEYYSNNQDKINLRKQQDSLNNANIDVNWSLSLSTGTGFAYFDGQRTMNDYKISCDIFAKYKNQEDIIAQKYKNQEDIIAQLILGTSSVFVEYDNDSTSIGNSIDGKMTTIYGGLAIKKYFTPHYTFFDFYLSGGLNFSYLMWDYRNKIEADGHKISDDGLFGVDWNFNAGVNLIKTDWFKLGTELKTGIYLWSDETNEEFTNDLFKFSPYARLTLVLSFDKR